MALIASKKYLKQHLNKSRDTVCVCVCVSLIHIFSVRHSVNWISKRKTWQCKCTDIETTRIFIYLKHVYIRVLFSAIVRTKYKQNAPHSILPIKKKNEKKNQKWIQWNEIETIWMIFFYRTDFNSIFCWSLFTKHTGILIDIESSRWNQINGDLHINALHRNDSGYYVCARTKSHQLNHLDILNNIKLEIICK